MYKKAIPSRRSIIDVPDSELKEAVMDMVNRLHMPGKGDGYDLYKAVLDEKRRAGRFANTPAYEREDLVSRVGEH